MPKRHIVLVHGIGSQRPGYADGLWRRLQRAGVKIAPEQWHEVCWQHVVEPLSSAVRRTKSRLLAPLSRRLFCGLVGDAILYGRERVAGLIRLELVRTLKRLPRGAEVIFVAHSLGTVVLSDVLHDLRYGDDNDEGFHGDFVTRRIITMGSPLRLYIAGRHGAPSNGLLEEYKPPAPALGWKNLVCPLDPVAWPLSDWVPGVTDIPAWNWLRVHTGYWRRRKLVELIRKAI